MSRPEPINTEDRVVPFRRPGSLARHHAPAPDPAVPDLEKYERITEEPDEYRHRMLMNGLALVVTAALIAGGLWIAEVMAHMRKDQDCALQGRRNCAQIETPSR